MSSRNVKINETKKHQALFSYRVGDMDEMIKLGFSKVFCQPDISDLVRHGMEKELCKLTPQFLVGGEK